MSSTPPGAIAIIGMAGRFPGADSVDELWRNLLGQVESVRPLTDDQLRCAGVPSSLRRRPAYVAAGAELRDADAFDGEFFGVPDHEARVMDPQQRVFLECANGALEDAGYTPDGLTERVGVFGSTSASSYLLNVLAAAGEMTPGDVNYPMLLGNDKDFLATRVSYKLGLTGPSLTVQTACSGSLTAVHLACQSLLERECSIALAGGVSITVPLGHGYLYREGGILSRDGHCRVFDTEASGTVKGSGCAVVALRPLADALAAGDHVYAVIRGTAINNDGSDKVGFTAPSPAGQQEVIREALAVAEVPAADIGYVEAHGTGTALGDPIELRALRAAHAADGPPPERCLIGSLKANVGHLDAAAGAAGLIKTALVLRDQRVPGQPTLRSVSPRLELAGTGYVVPPATVSAAVGAAAVSSFGLGGTNAHAVLTAAPPRDRDPLPAGVFRIPLAAPDADSLREAARRLRDWCAARPTIRIDDIALTLRHGRRALAHRVEFVVAGVPDLVAALDGFVESGRAPAAADPGTRPADDLSRAQRVALPGTVLRRRRHWVEVDTAAGTDIDTVVDTSSEPVGPAAGADRAEVAAQIADLVAGHVGRPVGADDDIFDLGVDSMNLVEIVTELRDRLAVPISFEEAEAARTPAALSALLGPRIGVPAVDVAVGVAALDLPGGARDEVQDLPTENARPTVGPIPVRVGRGGRNVFLVHPAGGTTVCYIDLARHLDASDSVYGLAFPADLVDRPQSIRALARRYLDQVRTVQPAGPYRIGGYSFGGNVAFEMALLLQGAGEQVEQVVLFDSHPPEAYIGGHIGDGDYAAAFPVLVRALFADTAIPTDRTAGTVSEALELVRQPGWSDSMMRELAAFFDVWRNNHDALRRYYPDERVRAQVVVLEAQEPEDAADLARLGMRVVPKSTWQQHVDGGLLTIPVPGNHYSMFRDARHVRVLAGRLQQVLAA